MEEGKKRRIICHIDMDCFYVSVERARCPELFGVPMAVVQYNPFEKGGVTDRAADDPARIMYPDDPFTPQRSANPCTASPRGSMIAVSYEARAKGVKRGLRAGEALKLCPELVLVQVPTAFGKADLEIYKTAGDQVVEVLGERATYCEKKSVDEVALDISEAADSIMEEYSCVADFLNGKQAQEVIKGILERNPESISEESDDISRETRWGTASHIEGVDQITLQGIRDFPATHLNRDEARLIAGGIVVREMRQAVYEKLRYSCSGGVAFNKLMAKFCCGLHKPNQQTILLPQGVTNLLKDLPIGKMPQLGGKLGERVASKFNIKTVGELSMIPKGQLSLQFGDSCGKWLHDVSHGEEDDKVKDRRIVKCLGSSKTFFSHHCLRDIASVEYWLNALCKELWKRALKHRETHNETPTTLSVGLSQRSNGEGFKPHGSRQTRIDFLRMTNVDDLLQVAVQLCKRWISDKGIQDVSITGLGASLSDMVPIDNSSLKITTFFTPGTQRPLPVSANTKPNRPRRGTSRKGKRNISVVDLFLKNGADSTETSTYNAMKGLGDTEREFQNTKQHCTSSRLSQAGKQQAQESCAQSTKAVEVIEIDLVEEKPSKQQTDSGVVTHYSDVEVSQIDETVLAALPFDMAHEIRTQIQRSRKRQKKQKDQFFQPKIVKKCIEIPD